MTTPIYRNGKHADPEVDLITAYLGDELPEAVEIEVERRLVEDEAFLEKVQPIIVVWRQLARLHVDEVAAGKRRLRFSTWFVFWSNVVTAIVMAVIVRFVMLS